MPWLQSPSTVIVEPRKDPLEKGMATHSSVFAWRILGPEGPDGPQSMGLQSPMQLSHLLFTTAVWQAWFYVSFMRSAFREGMELWKGPFRVWMEKWGGNLKDKERFLRGKVNMHLPLLQKFPRRAAFISSLAYLVPGCQKPLGWGGIDPISKFALAAVGLISTLGKCRCRSCLCFRASCQRVYLCKLAERMLHFYFIFLNWQSNVSAISKKKVEISP